VTVSESSGVAIYAGAGILRGSARVTAQQAASIAALPSRQAVIPPHA
jgi:hypothetical protein